MKNYQWTLKYNSNIEGLLVLGDSPIEYDPIFKNKKYMEHKYKNHLNFGIKFDDDIIKNKSLNVNKEVHFYHELGVFLLSKIF